VATVVAFYFSGPLVRYIVAPAKVFLVYTRPGEAFWAHFQVSIAAAFVATFPVLIYHVLAFIFPGLTPKERKWVWWTLFPVVGLFVGGVLFAYFVLVPTVYAFFMGFGSDVLQPMITVAAYISFVTGLVIPFGVVFELPVLIALLAGLGLVTPAFLSRYRKYAILVIFIAAAFLTPGTDPISQTLMALPLMGLYEVSVGISKIIYRRKRNARTRLEAEAAAS
jgi:sec-independent protein translocase protein TatC